MKKNVEAVYERLMVLGEKGINCPDSYLNIPAIRDEDMENFQQITVLADKE